MKTDKFGCRVWVALDVPNEGGFTATCDKPMHHKGDHEGTFDEAADYYCPKRRSKKYPEGCVHSSVILKVSWPNVEG